MKFFYAVATLAGTMIGAGLFALPYITTQAGIEVILIYFLFLGLISVAVHHFFGDVALKTEDNLRLPSFAKIHLGSWAKKLTLCTGLIGLSGSILAYIILGGEFLSGLFSPSFGGGAFEYSLIYWGVGSALIFFGIKAIEKIESIGIIGFVMVLFLIFIQGFENINTLEFLEIGEGFGGDLFLPYGAILFSLWGAALIPEVEEMLDGEKEKLKWVAPVGVGIAILIYLFFIFIIVGISGAETSQEGIKGLMQYFDGGIIGLALIFGLLATFTSFVTLGLTLKKILWYDLGISERISWEIVTFVPLSAFLFGIDDYIQVISFVGATLLAIDAILITTMYQKYKPAKYKFLTYPIILVFVLGIIYNIVYNKEILLNLID
jgi:tyrosine-specific transport protein